MTDKIGGRIGAGLKRFAAVEGDMIVNRPPRRAITGIEFDNQICRLLLDEPDASGNEAYACKIANISEDGFGVVCGLARTNPQKLRAGAQLTLQEADGERVRVEIRWIKSDRLGLRRLGAKAKPASVATA